MAGCTPIHLPVLIAGARALADPKSNSIQFSVSTGSWAYQWLINGPIRDDIDIQYGTGAFGPGFRANRTIGRALGLAYKNVTRLHPGVKDMAVVGNPFKYSLIAGENEDLNPWEPYHVTHGYEEDQSTITLGGPNSFIGWTPYQNDAQHVLEGMVYHMSPNMFGKGHEVDGLHRGTVFHILNPYNAEELSEAGLSKQEVKELVCESSSVPRYKYTRGALHNDALETYPGNSLAPRLKQIADPEHVKVVVAGGGGRVNAVIGRSIGGPVTKKINLPDNWNELLDTYRTDTEWLNDAQYYD
ncbi:hypothetical protein ACFQE1_04805 [Halobium palmae]|uniref:Uncharacterized protein n=1 Tax=Halobium palmae TaxID=1776492 RepID=A0ABD5RWE5_9EURY